MKTAELPDAVNQAIESLATGDKAEVSAAYYSLLVPILGEEGCLRTDLPREVEWADPVWVRFVALLDHEDNHVRSIAGQMLSNLAQSADPKTVIRDLDKIVAVTRDEKFVTARHVLQSLWKVGLGDEDLRKATLSKLSKRFKDSSADKNTTLIRFDIVVGLRALYDAIGNEKVREVAVELISLEGDEKYRKKYARVWSDLRD